MNTTTTATPPTATALLADDEEGPREQLQAALKAGWPALRIVATAANGVDAWDSFLEHEPDVCFLDIRMPGMSGIDVARRVGTRSAVVFVSAYGDHALAAFDAGAVDYVLKPVEPQRLAQSIARLQARLKLAVPQHEAAAQPPAEAPDTPSSASMQDLLQQLARQVRRPPPLSVLQASVGREVRLIPIDQVLYFESDSRYTRVVHTQGDALIRTPLKELLAQLDEQLFWQVHRSVIVNHRCIASAVRVDDSTMVLALRGREERLPVSRHFQGLFKGQ